MESDTPNPQNLSPQDPTRFSKPKSEPPILDLEAETSTQRKKPDSGSDAKAPRQDTGRVVKPSSFRGILSGFVGGLIGGGLIALGVLAYDRFSHPINDELAALSQALDQKVNRDEVVSLQSRLAAIEVSLDATKAEFAASAKANAAPDPQITKRITSLEETIRSLNKNPQSAISAPDQRGVKLALLLSMRDGLRNDASVQSELNALEKIGESSSAFRDLKLALATPLVAYEELHADVLKRIKSFSLPHDTDTSSSNSQSRISSFLSQLITVRPATTVTPKFSATDLSFTPLLDALDENDAAAALNAIDALPQNEKDMFAPVTAELKRRADVERNIAVMTADTLDMIAKGDAP